MVECDGGGGVAELVGKGDEVDCCGAVGGDCLGRSLEDDA